MPFGRLCGTSTLRTLYVMKMFMPYCHISLETFFMHFLRWPPVLSAYVFILVVKQKVRSLSKELKKIKNIDTTLKFIQIVELKMLNI